MFNCSGFNLGIVECLRALYDDDLCCTHTHMRAHIHSLYINQSQFYIAQCTVILSFLRAESLPSRMLPQRTWAASVPTPLSHDALCKLLTPVSVNGQQPCCPLERFLASVFLRRHLLRIMQSADNVGTYHLLHFVDVQCSNKK